MKTGLRAPVAFALSVWGLASGVAVAVENYPARPVRLVIPFPPGGSNDIVGRVVAAQLSERLGRQVVSDNRPGADAIIGTDMVAKSAPDGYNLLVISTSFTTNPLVHKLPYDSLKDFSWVAMLGTGPNALTVFPKMPVNSVKELVAMAKAQPGKITYASSGVGGFQHFSTELFNMLAGIRMVHVPYKGGAPAMQDVMGGQTQVTLGSLVQALPFIRSGRLKALGTGALKRTAILPDVPTIAEGVPGYESINWWAVAAPAKTPPAVVRKLNAEIAAVLGQAEVRKIFSSQGVEADVKTPEALGQHVAAEMAKWGKVAKAANIRGE